MTPTTTPAVPPPAHRLHRRTDIRAVFAARTGSRGRAADLRVRWRGDEDPARWTVVAGRKVGDAVRRNRAKRRLRGALREVALPVGVDLVVIAKSPAVSLPYPDLRADVALALRKLTARHGRSAG